MRIRVLPKGAFKDPSKMTLAALSKRLTRVKTDLDAMADELDLRGFDVDAIQMEEASECLDSVVLRFCDDCEGFSSLNYGASKRTPPGLIPPPPKRRKPKSRKAPKSKSKGDSASWLENLGSLEDPREKDGNANA